MYVGSIGRNPIEPLGAVVFGNETWRLLDMNGMTMGYVVKWPTMFAYYRADLDAGHERGWALTYEEAVTACRVT